VGISPYLQVSLAQKANLPVKRIIPIASTLFAGGFSALFLTIFICLFVRFEKRDKK
jgi:hypothetical protein